MRNTSVSVWIIVLAVQLSCSEPHQPSVDSGVLEVRAVYDPNTNQHLFETDTNVIQSGWTTVRLVNASPNVHFLVLELLPGDKRVEDLVQEVVPVFQQAMDRINEGRAEDGFALLGELPDWFGELIFMGGPGLLSPGRSSEVTIYLEPGNYSMECYVKTEEGIFHSALGMIRGLTVTEERSKTQPPSQATLEMTLTNQGFGVRGEPTPGKHLVAVHFAEENPPFLGNDVHLVRLDTDTDSEQVTAWMDWSHPAGLVSGHHTAAPAEFLGGTHEMPQGYSAYFTVELQPGRYAWVSERPANQPLYEEFTVPLLP